MIEGLRLIRAIVDRKRKVVCFLLCLCVFAPGTFAQGEPKKTELPGTESQGAQNGTIPDTIRRPERGEAPRYPKDMVIGELGRGESPDEAYQLARRLLSVLVAESGDAQIMTDSLSILTESQFEELSSIVPRSYRIGGGRIEADGSVSFLVRFIGNEESISGELYLRQAENEAAPEANWLLDDLILEDKRTISEIRDSYRYDFSPYERFY